MHEFFSLLSSSHEVFSYHFCLHEFFFWFPPHYFSNGGSLVFDWEIFYVWRENFWREIIFGVLEVILLKEIWDTEGNLLLRQKTKTETQSSDHRFQIRFEWSEKAKRKPGCSFRCWKCSYAWWPIRGGRFITCTKCVPVARIWLTTVTRRLTNQSFS